jgi:hypothetical protein
MSRSGSYVKVYIAKYRSSGPIPTTSGPSQASPGRRPEGSARPARRAARSRRPGAGAADPLRLGGRSQPRPIGGERPEMGA